MNVSFMLLILVCCLSLLGCANEERCQVVAHKAGSVQMSKAGRMPSDWVAAEVIEYEAICLGTPSTTDNVLRLPKMELNGATWEAILGPNPPADVCADRTGGTSKPVSEQRRVAFTFANPNPGVQIGDGWVYIRAEGRKPAGQWGSGRTKRVRAGVIGTEMILQSIGEIDRVFLLSTHAPEPKWPAGIHVELFAGPILPPPADPGNAIDQGDVVTSGTYLEVNPTAAQLPTPQPISSAPPEVQKFVRFVQDIVSFVDSNNP